MCGGTPYYENGDAEVEGLSPRVRGNPFVIEGLLTPGWSIPACAGEPAPLPILRKADRVYPRVCGGTNEARWARQRREGLSPRVRGNPAAAGPAVRGAGSIPACAGEPGRKTAR